MQLFESSVFHGKYVGTHEQIEILLEKQTFYSKMYLSHYFYMCKQWHSSVINTFYVFKCVLCLNVPNFKVLFLAGLKIIEITIVNMID